MQDQEFEEVRRTVDRWTWKVDRYCLLDEVEFSDGNIRYHVQVQDAGRTPFLTRWFNEESRAMDFIREKVMSNAKGVKQAGGLE